MTIDIFTSANINYLAKAKMLARSLKKQHPSVRVHLMLSDKIPNWLHIEQEDFDSIITIDDLDMDEGWVFKHSVVELCTAVKPFCFQYIMNTYASDYLFYFDPDVVVFSTLDRLLKNFDHHSILLTPHVCKPEHTKEAIVDNETSCLRHGIYNLGFLGVKNDIEGRRLIDWWAHRLTDFCQDNIPFGVFTDQRWMDFVPVYFDYVKILKDPIYNVATWNYSTRNLTGSIYDEILVDEQPICFHHFSGVDNGASLMMINKYANDMPVALELDTWYKQECNKMGQEEVIKAPWFYGYYDNGEKIERSTRLLFRGSNELQKEFSHPLKVDKLGNKFAISFYYWMVDNKKNNDQTDYLNLIPFTDFLKDSQNSMLYYIERTTKLSRVMKRVCQYIIRFVTRILLKII